MIKYITQKYGTACTILIITIITTTLSVIITSLIWKFTKQHNFALAFIISCLCPVLITPPLVYSYTRLVMKLEENRNALQNKNKELEKALSEIKVLTGLLPICTTCKKIRDDQGYWNNLESYIHSRSEVQFSHGICPDCAKELYPEYNLYPDS